MINRLKTGVFGLPRQGGCRVGRQWGAYLAPGGFDNLRELPNMSGFCAVCQTMGQLLPPR